jgi:hypothetical protein
MLGLAAMPPTDGRTEYPNLIPLLLVEVKTGIKFIQSISNIDHLKLFSIKSFKTV